ncbi:tRNA (adenosine(37)-N6)-dimethylallyltransferase MiaA [Histidinibacterium lentulum]|uniref:tRNA dimethylallyltransferase n=1 Tax=Histidinibacterium lentulum TaxID=2480588 RepID=A0A3N2R9Q8_9RHOB|nr:tRNA (adenosine(37)-N6)-dimethylallyltransferase MiaA [Histidinibacterium lentulum]ROU04209.1 tRNA (adenosine(37)-N6)-dimethylallyltransferase MiaA [Histidinibacterium lentulum]
MPDPGLFPRFSGIALPDIPDDRPVLIAGPTASGKSALALRISEERGGVIVNADALQVFDGWRILTARPDARDLARASHALYGHVPHDARYSTGDWLRDLRPVLSGPLRPIIVGGTGLFFSALTEGLAEIPPTPAEVRVEANTLSLDTLIAGLDTPTRANLDLQNRARVQRAWEVARATGRQIADWQAETPPPDLPLSAAVPLVLRTEVPWLDARIAARFDAMLAAGVLEEARAMRPRWDPAHQSAKAIGAAELIAHADGLLDIDAVRQRVVLATRQYAKRQRTWFRNRMKSWSVIPLPSPD